jgi:hypothetical protein
MVNLFDQNLLSTTALYTRTPELHRNSCVVVATTSVPAYAPLRLSTFVVYVLRTEAFTCTRKHPVNYHQGFYTIICRTRRLTITLVTYT